ncbi:MAG: vWA domain-containing protein [Myxococcota bacterium]
MADSSFAVAISLATALTVFGCSGSEGSQAGSGGNSMINIGSGGNGAASGNGSQNSGGAPPVVNCNPQTDGSACIGESYEGEAIPLDIYVMFDQSGSMCSCIDPAGGIVCPDANCKQTRLDAVRKAAEEFLRDPRSTGMNVGIGYFGKQPIGQAICDEAEYANASVQMGRLPGHAQAIVDSLNEVKPTGETPTSAAIRGACSYASAWKRSVPAHQVVILLLTDGKPEAPVTCQGGSGSCCPTLDDAVAAAAECRNGPLGIKTYVLGVGPLLQNLQQIAQAGGTDHAYLVESGDVSREVVNALNRIRADATIPCEFELPAPSGGQMLLYDRVNVQHSDSSCNLTTFPYVESQARCGAQGGWYYDDPTRPHKISLCPTSCDLVSIPGGRFNYSLGCETITIK